MWGTLSKIVRTKYSYLWRIMLSEIWCCYLGYFQTLYKNMFPSSSGPSSPRSLLELLEGSMILQNSENYSLNNIASYPQRPQPSTAPMWEPAILHIYWHIFVSWPFTSYLIYQMVVQPSGMTKLLCYIQTTEYKGKEMCFTLLYTRHLKDS